MVDIFKKEGAGNSRNKEYQFWRQDNVPKECYSQQVSRQQIEYVPNNPVEAGIVDKPEEYSYSSARDYHYSNRLGLLQIEWL